MIKEYGKISIIVPVYNVEQYVEKALLSIMNQTYTDLEIIIIDDGSTDKSNEIVRRVIQDDDRCIFISRSNKGIGKTRSEGLNIASGDYIAWVDSDDYIELNMYELMLEDMDNNNSDMVICNTVHLYADGTSTQRDLNYHFDSTVIDVKEEFDTVLRYLPVALWPKLTKRRVYENIVFEDNVAEDDVILGDIVKRLNKISFVQIPLYNYFATRPGNSMSVNNFKNFKERCKVYIRCFYKYKELTSNKEVLLTKYGYWFNWYMRHSLSFRFRTLFFQRFLKKQRDFLDMTVLQESYFEFVKVRSSFRFKLFRKFKSTFGR